MRHRPVQAARHGDQPLQGGAGRVHQPPDGERDAGRGRDVRPRLQPQEGGHGKTTIDNESANQYNSKNILQFYNCHDLGQLDIWDGLFKSLTEARDALIEGQPPLLPDEAVKYCMLACYFGLLWYR